MSVRSFFQLALAGVVSFCALIHSPSTATAEVIGFEEFYNPASPDGFSYGSTSLSPSSISGSLSIVSPAGSFLTAYAVSSKSSFSGPAPLANFANLNDATNYWLNGDDTVSITGAGANNSNTWLSVFNGNYTPPGEEIYAGDAIFVLPAEMRFQQVSVTNLLLSEYAFENDFNFSSAFSPGDFFRVRFLSLNAQDDVIGTSAWYDLASYLGPQLVSLDTWQSIDLSALNTNRLGFEFTGTDITGPYINTPTYLAFDNFVVAAIPEPSSIALLSAACTSGLAIHRRRKLTRVGS